MQQEEIFFYKIMILRFNDWLVSTIVRCDKRNPTIAKSTLILVLQIRYDIIQQHLQMQEMLMFACLDSTQPRKNY